MGGWKVLRAGRMGWVLVEEVGSCWDGSGDGGRG